MLGTKVQKKVTIIHCIGDSHVNFFSGNDYIQPIWPDTNSDKLTNFKTYRLGSHLAHSLANQGSEARKKLEDVTKRVPKKSCLLLSYGEIDCRVHLMKQSIIQNKSLKRVVNECVDGYFKLIKMLVNRGFDVMIWEPIPSTRFNISYQEFITFGSNIERNLVTAIFNNRLRKKAEKEKIPVISISKYLLNENNTTNMKYYSDPIHLSTRALPFAVGEIKKFKDGVDLYARTSLFQYAHHAFFKKNIHILYVKINYYYRKIVKGADNLHRIDKKREKQMIYKYGNELRKYHLTIAR